MPRHSIEHHSNDFTSVEFPSKKVAYTQEGLEKLLHDRRRLQEVASLFPDVDKRGKPNAFIESGDVRVTAKGYLGPEKWKDQEAFYYKLDVPEGSFFVKRIPGKLNYETGGGYDEFVDTREARRLLSKIKGVEVADYVLGYEDKKNLYFVSAWDDKLEYTLEQHLANLEREAEGEEGDPNNEARRQLEELKARIEDIRDALGEAYWDTRPHNMAYDRKTDKIYIFDLNRKQERP